MRARLLGTPSFRLSLLWAGMSGLAAVLVFGTMYWAATRFMNRQFDRTIALQLASLQDADRAGGHSRVADLIGQRLASPVTREFSYLLEDVDGRRLAGNLPAVIAAEGWHSVPASSGEEKNRSGEHALRALGKRLPDGSHLLVGRDPYELDDVADFMESIFVAGFALTLAVALATGALAGAGFLRRLDDIIRTSQQIIATGDLSRRIPIRGTDNFASLAANLNGMLERIQALMEGMQQASNDIAHDMRTPLTRLHYRLEEARASAKTVEDFQAAIDGALAELDTLIETFSALLRIAQISSGSRRAGFAATDLTAVARTVTEVYAPVAEDGGRALTALIDDGVTVKGDRRLLAQMTANLVENALKHTPTGSSVCLVLRSDGADGGPSLVVADNGPGIPAADRDKVFRRFCRLDASRTIPGSGLGLTLVAAIAGLHDARVRLDDNAPGLRAGVYWPR